MLRRLVSTSRALLVLTTLAVTYLSLVPSPPEAVSGPDKLVHLLAYAALGLLAGLSLGPGITGTRAVVAVIAGVAAYGAIVEAAQRLTGRDLDVVDMIANTAGAAAGVSLALLARRILTRGRTKTGSAAECAHRAHGAGSAESIPSRRMTPGQRSDHPGSHGR